MFQDSFVDLDELLLRCKERQTKGQIAEAIACYRAGAFRAAIVSTWIAVVFDFIHKLRDLALTGDAAAQRELDNLERWQRQGDWRQINKFESRVLTMAKDIFEFLSVSEYDDLLRLYDDRNRCAHPSMLNLEEPYEATAELSRYHLRNAVIHLLQHPPVQGKAALDRMLTEIQSEYFPRSTEQAIEQFQHSPLARARKSLVRNIVLLLTKCLLLEDHSNRERGRYFAALNAILKMYIDIGEVVLRENLPKIVEGIDDAQWLNVIKYLRRVALGWETLGNAGQAKARAFVTSCSLQDNRFMIRFALPVPGLEEFAVKRIPELTNGELAEHIEREPLLVYADDAIRRFASVSSYREGTMIASTLLLPLVSQLNAEQVKRITTVYLENRQLYDSSNTLLEMGNIFEETEQYAEETKDHWIQIYRRLGIEKEKRYGQDGTRYDEYPLFALIEQKYPEALNLVSSL
jgi:hypothetical protein